MLAEAFEIVGSVGRNIIKGFALALGSRAWRFLSVGSEVIMIFEFMVAKTFGFRANHLTILPLFIPPGQVESIFGFF
jgi:hypothetical protein